MTDSMEMYQQENANNVIQNVKNVSEVLQMSVQLVLANLV
jgi:hypothetical protein